jgi:hypothetical protein
MDIQLQLTGGCMGIVSFIECKAVTCKEAMPTVQFREAAQIVAWLMQRYRPETAKVTQRRLSPLSLTTGPSSSMRFGTLAFNDLRRRPGINSQDGGQGTSNTGNGRRGQLTRGLFRREGEK